MNCCIEIIKGVNEKTLPIIKLTKSKNGKTGTATFLFFISLINLKNYSIFNSIDKVSLIYKETKIISKKIVLFFREGKPFLLKITFIFKTQNEWFDFFKFIFIYSKENSLMFLSNK